jgi:hypothetical protein
MMPTKRPRRKRKHSYLLMLDWAHDESKPVEVRAAMIKEAASYTCTKPKITVRSEIPAFTSVDQAESFLATIAAENDLDPIELATMVRHWIDSKRAGKEFDRKVVVDGGGGDQTITIQGGMPPLPGTNINMAKEPTLNGMTNGHIIEHEQSRALTDSTESIQSEAPQSEPIK